MIALITLLVFLVTFLMAGLAVLVAWLTLHRGKQPLEVLLAETLDQASGPQLFKEHSISTIGVWDSLLQRFDFSDMLQRRLEQAGVSWSVGRFTLLMLLCGTAGFAFVLHWNWAPLWLALLCGFMLTGLPYFYILKKRAKRFFKFEEAFPDALDSLARALRAGHPLSAGMEILANESTPPVSTELRKVAIEGNLGMSWEVALQNLSRRMPLLEVNMFVSAIQLQSRTGGKLNEVLSNLSETMRASTALKGEVRALAAHGKLTGIVLTALPLVIAAIMLVVNPGYLAILLQHPTGKYLIVAAIACLIAGHFVIRRLVDIRI
ncbi:MAG: type II secretion system F family protein [Bryobacteraceae bacterium]